MVIFHSYVNLPEGNTPDVFHPGYKQKNSNLWIPAIVELCLVIFDDIPRKDSHFYPIHAP